MASDCNDIYALIGRPYRLGADGSDTEIDCIHVVYAVLGSLAIPTPDFNHDWYTASPTQIARALLRWGRRIKHPQYDGDVLLTDGDTRAFAVTWQNGILYINRHFNRVAWSPISMFIGQPCFRTRDNFSN